MTDVLARYLAYAAAFEEAFRSDDWSVVAPYFTEDAVYRVSGGPPIGGTWIGRDAVLAHFRDILNYLDRRLDKRIQSAIAPPRVEGNTLEVKWRGTYGVAGAPEAELGGIERVVFEGERIKLLEDVYEEGASERISEYVSRYLS
jgi:hypothetical protein